MPALTPFELKNLVGHGFPKYTREELDTKMRGKQPPSNTETNRMLFFTIGEGREFRRQIRDMARRRICGTEMWTLIEPIARKMTYKYAHLFLEAQTEAESEDTEMDNPHASDALMARMGFPEPARVPCLTHPQGKKLLRWAIEGEFRNMKKLAVLHVRGEPKFNERVGEIAPRVRKWESDMVKAEKATNKKTIKRSRKDHLLGWNSRELKFLHAENGRRETMYMYNLAPPIQARALSKSGRETPLLAEFTLQKMKDTMEGFDGWLDENSVPPHRYWLGWTWRGQEFALMNDDQLRNMIRWCEKDELEAEVTIHVGRAIAPRDVREAKFAMDPHVGY
ncbi:unnamed protein product [Zymoseptoria tritici ST99CH_3D1]|nr:unnamed protein product [Zymoseptoria tritici ST99CH_3D1]